MDIREGVELFNRLEDTLDTELYSEADGVSGALVKQVKDVVKLITTWVDKSLTSLKNDIGGDINKLMNPTYDRKDVKPEHILKNRPKDFKYNYMKNVNIKIPEINQTYKNIIYNGSSMKLLYLLSTDYTNVENSILYKKVDSMFDSVDDINVVDGYIKFLAKIERYIVQLSESVADITAISKSNYITDMANSAVISDMRKEIDRIFRSANIGKIKMSSLLDNDKVDFTRGLKIKDYDVASGIKLDINDKQLKHFLSIKYLHDVLDVVDSGDLYNGTRRLFKDMLKRLSSDDDIYYDVKINLDNIDEGKDDSYYIRVIDNYLKFFRSNTKGQIVNIKDGHVSTDQTDISHSINLECELSRIGKKEVSNRWQNKTVKKQLNLSIRNLLEINKVISQLEKVLTRVGNSNSDIDGEDVDKLSPAGKDAFIKIMKRESRHLKESLVQCFDELLDIETLLRCLLLTNVGDMYNDVMVVVQSLLYYENFYYQLINNSVRARSRKEYASRYRAAMYMKLQ